MSPAWPSDWAANGIATYVDRVVGSLRRIGHQPTIIACESSHNDLPADVYVLAQEPRSYVSRVLDPVAFRLCPDRAFRRHFSVRILSATRRAIAKRHVELLEMEETFGVAQLVTKQLDIPVLVRLHGPRLAGREAPKGSLNAADRLAMRHERSTLLHADAISAPSCDVLEKARVHYGLALPDAAVIPPPAPVVSEQNRWRLSECQANRILFVGRFDRHKGGDLVIDAMRTILRHHPAARLSFVGPDRGFVDDAGRMWTLPEYLAERARDVASSVDWLGQQPPAVVDALRRQSFLTVVASRYENMAIVVLEAMAYGCPLVATRAGGLEESIVDGVNGLMCRSGDAADLGSTIVRLLNAPDLATKLGEQAARQAATRFHPDTIARETNAIHRSTIERYRARRSV